MLQGPASPVLARVAAELEGRGARVVRVLFCLGDAVFWRRPAVWFRAPAERWPAFVEALMRENGVTDLLMLGDGRPRHLEAIEAARRQGVRIHVFEHGYIRPDFLTLEPEGMSSASRFPREPARIRRLAESLPERKPPARYGSSFLVYALYDLAFHLPNVVLGPLVHRHYRTHGPVHPLVEYAGWIGKALARPLRRRRTARALARIEAHRGPIFLLPLQLPGDYQIRIHAPGGDLHRLVAAIVRSFVEHAPEDALLVCKVHPLDNGLSGWAACLARAAGAAAPRVLLLDGGNLDALIAASRGVVTVNSTVGTAALAAGCPLAAVGNAVYDCPGLTHQGPLAEFWMSPQAPDPLLVRAFLKALAGSIQVHGSFIDPKGMADAATAFADRILDPSDPFRGTGEEGPVTGFRYARELTENAR